MFKLDFNLKYQEVFNKNRLRYQWLPWYIAGNPYNDVIMSTMESQIISVWIVCLMVCLVADQRKHQSTMSLAFVRGIHQWLEDSLHNWPSLQCCHNEHDSISNHQRLYCSLNGLFGRRSKKTWKLCITGLSDCWILPTKGQQCRKCLNLMTSS